MLSRIADNLGRDLLRRSRIRLDVACLLAFRSYVASLPMKDVSINIWIDASPQWRSRELLSSFGSVIAQGDGAPKVERMLFPIFPMFSCWHWLAHCYRQMRSIALANVVDGRT